MGALTDYGICAIDYQTDYLKKEYCTQYADEAIAMQTESRSRSEIFDNCIAQNYF